MIFQFEKRLKVNKPGFNALDIEGIIKDRGPAENSRGRDYEVMELKLWKLIDEGNLAAVALTLEEERQYQNQIDDAVESAIDSYERDKV